MAGVALCFSAACAATPVLFGSSHRVQSVPASALAEPAPKAEARPLHQQTREAAAGPLHQIKANIEYRRIRTVDASALADELLKAKKVDLEDDAHPGASKLILADAVARREDLAGLPWQDDRHCYIGEANAKVLGPLSVALRDALEKHRAITQTEFPLEDSISQRHSDVSPLYDFVFKPLTSEEGVWRRAEAVPALVQALTGEEKEYRLLLVEALGQIADRTASVALARQALFDRSEEIREAAIRQLADRPRSDYRVILLEGLRYPWPPVAEHAAEALVALRDVAALPTLVRLFEEPDPVAPFVDERWPQILLVKELVRINHLRNCFMCHAPSNAFRNSLNAAVPTPGVPIPTSSAYYEFGRQNRFIRADITYLRQDFSMLIPVAEVGPWPMYQRFDYVVRTRRATKREIAAASGKNPVEPYPPYPQRETVLFALRELTGKDAGRSSDDWRRATSQLLMKAAANHDP
jgi:hypothetical protein